MAIVVVRAVNGQVVARAGECAPAGSQFEGETASAFSPGQAAAGHDDA